MRKQITIHPAQADKYTCSLLVISVVLSAMMKKKWNYVDSQEYFIIENLQGHDLQHLVLHCRRSGSSCEDQVCLAEKIRFVLRRRAGSSSDSSCAEDEVRPQIRLAEKMRFVLRFVLWRRSGSSSDSSCGENQVRPQVRLAQKIRFVLRKRATES